MFLKMLVGCGFGLMGLGCSPGKSSPPTVSHLKHPGRSRVVTTFSKDLLKDGEVDAGALGIALRAGIERYSGLSWDAFWKKHFTSDDVVALKVNTVAGPRMSTHPSLVRLICAALSEAGVRDRNIIVFDRSRRELDWAGFSDETVAPGKCAATDDPGIGYDGEPTSLGSIASRFCRIVSTRATAIINMPILKDHDATGITFSLKNNLGSIDNPNKCHPDGGDPYIADVNTAPFLKDKTRLVVGDAITAMFDRGPSWSPAGAWSPGALIIAEDPVAADSIALAMIEKKRKEKKLPSLAEEERRPSYISTAAGLGLGICDRSRIEHMVVRV
jgi:uncharacterized protein (DUF362 family)